MRTRRHVTPTKMHIAAIELSQIVICNQPATSGRKADGPNQSSTPDISALIQRYPTKYELNVRTSKEYPIQLSTRTPIGFGGIQNFFSGGMHEPSETARLLHGLGRFFVSLILDTAHSTVTDFARFLGLSTSWPRSRAAW